MAYVSIRQHTSAYDSIRLIYTALLNYAPLGSWGNTGTLEGFVTHFTRKEYGTFQLYSGGDAKPSQVHLACVSIRQHTSAYVSIRQHTSAYVSFTLEAMPVSYTDVC